MSKVKRVSAYDALEWARNLINMGYSVFSFPDLPDNLHIWAYHRKAISKGYVRKIGNKKAYNGQIAAVYIVPDEIMKINHCRQAL